MIHCSSCKFPYPEDSIPYRCPRCGGLFDFLDWPDFSTELVLNEPGIWRYRHFFGLPEKAPRIYLGEGNTPLVWSKVFDRDVAFKLEFLNPSGSFKDRGTALTVSFLRARGVMEAMDDSSGNAGASFAAYAAYAGMKAIIYLPAYASGPKREQIEAYGANIVAVEGARSRASDAVQLAAARGIVYASHAMLPHGLPGFATTAYELVNQLGCAPGTLILPAGQGTQILALGRAFQSLRKSGLIKLLPKLIGVQAEVCAPFYAASTGGKLALGRLIEGKTLAEGVRIKNPHRLDAVLQVVKESQGRFVVVKESDILSDQKQLAGLGLYVEPTSAIVWSGLKQIMEDVVEPVVVILTGSGLKVI